MNVENFARVIHPHIEAVLSAMPAPGSAVPPRFRDRPELVDLSELKTHVAPYLMFEPHEVVAGHVTHELPLVNDGIRWFAQGLASRERK
jgi:hypothetical protein